MQKCVELLKTENKSIVKKTAIFVKIALEIRLQIFQGIFFSNPRD